MKNLANEVREWILKATTEAGSGHVGGSLSIVEILLVLYGGILRHNPKEPFWNLRDRLILSKGHGCPALYVILGLMGYYPVEEIMSLRKLGSPFQGHPDRRFFNLVEASTGSLGQGLSIGIGMALAGKLDKKDYHNFVILGDGELNEGQVWEACMFAGHHKLDNLTAIIDLNNFQLDDETKKIINMEPLIDKFKSFNLKAYLCKDGHNMNELKDKILKAKNDGKPSVVIAKTIKGKGGGAAEGNNDYHGKALSKSELEDALRILRNKND